MMDVRETVESEGIFMKKKTNKAFVWIFPTVLEKQKFPYWAESSLVQCKWDLINKFFLWYCKRILDYCSYREHSEKG